MDPLSALLAKSAGVSRGRAGTPERLTVHLEATLRAAREVRRRVGRIEVADAAIDRRFWEAVALAGLAHDAGKVADGFQDMVAGRTRRWGERHEVLSLGFLPRLIPPDLLPWVATGVATHHRALTGEKAEDLETLYAYADQDELNDRFGTASETAVAALLDWLRSTAAADSLPLAPLPADGHALQPLVETSHRLLTDLLARWTGGAEPDDGLAAVLLQGGVTMADHLSSAHRHLRPAQPLDAAFRPRLERHLGGGSAALRSHQRAAAEITGDLLLRAPTGSGKTEAALLWAATQVADIAERTGGVPRVFYVLPYLASINAMADRLGALLGDRDAVGVAHSRAASYHLARAIAPEDADTGQASDADDEPCRADAAAKAVSRAAATRMFHETLRVGTPYQLLRAALAGPAHSGILLDAANSVFILDELHAFDPRRLGYLIATARLWQRLGGRVAVLSATLSDRLSALLAEHLHVRPLEQKAPVTAARHRLRTRDHHLTDPEAAAEIERRLARDESVLVVANNVAHAIALYDTLAPAVRERHGPDAALLLHSRFKRGDRTGIESRITERYGTRKTRRPGLLVATQVVEVSLDVDFDVLFTAAAPLESLLQRFGRVNRVAARPPTDVIVHRPVWTTRRGHSGEYADGIYDRAPVEAGWDILTAHDGRTLDEDDATDWLNTVYSGDWGEHWQQEVTRFQEDFIRAFLTFDDPFDDRAPLAETFDEMFEGTEAILAEDRGTYEDALAQAPGRAGRLLADEHLIPMPHWAGALTTYDRRLRIRVIDGDYTPEYGLTAVRGLPQQVYQPGEVL
ncbi:CRISPR-associated helicase Cas3' [Streptomyces sp. B1866]|uniref:CRISPR-associated helicase Cas3' n=1 Tax=Streptomyces sp. B1866 TaxID=3075431 RepID=UPI00288DC722|nr:CRISPR-associated helicase Cas3' [Streptomyces sp. B1866]MDT3395290.1 CRISPR-associated helicase Cas3' [Streptomyces sp. B1866]